MNKYHSFLLSSALTALALGCNMDAAETDRTTDELGRGQATAQEEQVGPEPECPEKPRPECPAAALPPADFCPDGTLVERKNESGCVTGFDCQR